MFGLGIEPGRYDTRQTVRSSPAFGKQRM